MTTLTTGRAAGPETSAVRRSGRGAGAGAAAGAVTATTTSDPGVCLPDEVDADLHLLRRTSFGPTPAALAELRSLGRRAWLEAQLAPATIDDTACDRLVARWPMASWDISTTVRNVAAGHWDAMLQVARATMVRQAWSRRQLLEVMVDLWSDHLHVASPSDEAWYCRGDYDTTVIRRHALGSFADMLVASARHPAMLRFLDNVSSRKGAPNENYGRELLELHTVGVGAGYGERDVQDCARLFTGLTTDYYSGQRRYAPEWHDTGAVRVLGWSAPAHRATDGERLQEQLLRWLAVQPATARRVVRKIAVRLVADEPSSALVERLAAVYLETGSQVVPVLRALLASEEFASSAGRKVKRPLEDMISTVRVLGAVPGPGTEHVDQLYWMIRGRGHAPFDWGPPNGYPDVAAAWQSVAGTLGAWNHHVELANGWWPSGLGVPPVASLLPAARPATVGALLDALADRLLMAPLAPRERAALLAYTGRPSSSSLTPEDELVGWRLGQLVSLVLDTPSFATR